MLNQLNHSYQVNEQVFMPSVFAISLPKFAAQVIAPARASNSEQAEIDSANQTVVEHFDFVGVAG